MSLEQRIKELEEKLALKNAYLNVKVSFDTKELKIPASVKKQVIEKVQELCLQLAEGVETQTEPEISVITREEVDILKQLAAKVLEKSSVKASETKEVKEETPVKTKKPTKHKYAMILTRDSLSNELKKKIDSDEIVQVVKHDEVQASVISKKGYRFVIPMEDIEIQQEQGE